MLFQGSPQALQSAVGSLTGDYLAGRRSVGESRHRPVPLPLIGVAAGAAIALFMPLCQLRRGNIIVDFFTTRCSAKTIQRLDQLGAILIAACFALLAWRTAVGGINAFRSGSGTMILGFPEWMTYAFMVPAFFLAGLIALAQGAGLMPDEKRLLP
ncbi:MAG: TRAP transporter small permease subunit [Betaproteobacteria bacterium]|nr:TRAP transporter small permease subunit [Betaproteobacteria bacterium]